MRSLFIFIISYFHWVVFYEWKIAFWTAPQNNDLSLFSFWWLWFWTWESKIIKIIKEAILLWNKEWMQQSLIKRDTLLWNDLKHFSYQINCNMWRIRNQVRNWFLWELSQLVINLWHLWPFKPRRRSKRLENSEQLVCSVFTWKKWLKSIHFCH